MPPKSAPLTQAVVRRMIKESVDAAIAAERARHANAGNNCSRSGQARGQYIQMIDYALWEVIDNGNTAPKTTVVEGVKKVIPPTTAEEKA
ncbi:hypothetical protein Tco_1139980 [Tanacetum coccineum]